MDPDDPDRMFDVPTSSLAKPDLDQMVLGPNNAEARLLLTKHTDTSPTIDPERVSGVPGTGEVAPSPKWYATLLDDHNNVQAHIELPQSAAVLVPTILAGRSKDLLSLLARYTSAAAAAKDDAERASSTVQEWHRNRGIIQALWDKF
jgi:hypothetical protein